MYYFPSENIKEIIPIDEVINFYKIARKNANKYSRPDPMVILSE